MPNRPSPCLDCDSVQRFTGRSETYSTACKAGCKDAGQAWLHQAWAKLTRKS